MLSGVQISDSAWGFKATRPFPPCYLRMTLEVSGTEGDVLVSHRLQMYHKLGVNQRCLKINLLVLDGPPEALSEDVIECSALSVHADCNVTLAKSLEIGFAREMAPLIAVENRRRRRFESAVDGAKNELHFEGIVELPTDDVARKPVDDRDEIQQLVGMRM